MKIVLLLIIIGIGYWGAKNYVPPEMMIFLYGFIAIAPLILIILRRNLLNSLLLFCILLLFSAIGNIAIPILPDFPPYRIVWIVVLMFFLADVALKKRKIVSGSMPLVIVMFLFCALQLISGIVSGSIYKEGEGLFLAFILNGSLVPFSVFFLSRNLVDDEQKIKKVFLLFTIIGLYLGLTGIFEHYKLDFLVFPKYIMDSSVGIHWGRSRGPFVQAGVNAMVVAMIFFMSFYLLQLERKIWTRLLIICSLISMLITLLFTYSRGAWIGFLFALLFVAGFLPRLRKILIIFTLVLIIAIGVQFSLDQLHIKKVDDGRHSLVGLDTKDAVTQRFTSMGSVYSRINIYATAWRMFLDKPVFGFGYNKFKESQKKYILPIKGIPLNIHAGISMHNTYGMILMELGLAGLSLFLFILIYIVRINKKLYNQLSSEGFISKGLIITCGGVIINYLIAMIGRDMQYMMFPNIIFYLVAGIADGIYNRHRLNSFHKEMIPGV